MRASSLGNLETFAMLLFAGSALATIIPTAIPLPPTKIDHTLFTALQKKRCPLILTTVLTLSNYSLYVCSLEY